VCVLCRVRACVVACLACLPGVSVCACVCACMWRVHRGAFVPVRLTAALVSVCSWCHAMIGCVRARVCCMPQGASHCWQRRRDCAGRSPCAFMCVAQFRLTSGWTCPVTLHHSTIVEPWPGSPSLACSSLVFVSPHPCKFEPSVARELAVKK